MIFDDIFLTPKEQVHNVLSLSVYLKLISVLSCLTKLNDHFPESVFLVKTSFFVPPHTVFPNASVPLAEEYL